MAKSRVPQKPSDFNAYVNNTANYLTAATGGVQNYTRLTVTATDYNTWQNYRTQWNDLYPKYSDKKESRTLAIIARLRKIIKDFTVFSRDVLNMISGVNTSTIDDLEVFNIKAKDLRDREPSPIHSTEPPTVSLINEGGAVLVFRVRKVDDTNRPSMLRNYFIEVRYYIGDTPPTDPDAPGFNVHMSSKAHFKLFAQAVNEGRKFYCWVRWAHKTTPGFNSGWCNLQQIVVA